MKTAIGVFASRAEAEHVVRRLESEGFAGADVRIVTAPAAMGAGGGGHAGLDAPGNMAGTGAYGDDRSSREFLKIGGLSDDFRAHYSRALGLGRALVCVTADEANVDRAVEVMERHDPLDVEEREGRAGPRTGATGMSPVRGDASVQTGRTRSSGGGPRVFVW